MKEDAEISKVWITGKSSYTIVIPKRFAAELSLDSNSYLIIKKIPDGLLIKNLEVKS